MMVKINRKKNIDDLALFGGNHLFPEFPRPKSTSNLFQPDFNNFLHYSKLFFSRKHYTNNGVLVKMLEERLAEFHHAEFCVTFCNGFWGLVLTMASLARKGKSEVIMPSLTYRRMADLAAWVGLKPHFCEVNPTTLSPDAQTVAECVNEDTALILAVHPIVNCSDIKGIVDLGQKLGVPVLFDSVESAYESTNGGKVGKFGNAECFSMHASKLLNGFEGGYVTTNSKALARRLSLLRTYGFEGQDHIAIPGGLNAKLNEIHAAMALANLDELDQLVADNRERYKYYQSRLLKLKGIRLIAFDESHDTSYKNIVVEVLERWPLSRDDTITILNAENILARAYYSPPLHLKKMSYEFVARSLETTERLAKRYMLLPCGDFVDRNDIDEIINLMEFIDSHGSEIARRNIQK